MWKCTGEELPKFLTEIAKSNEESEHATRPQNSSEDAATEADSELQTHSGPVMMSLNAHAANPVLNVLKTIDRHKAAIHYLEQALRKHHEFILTQAGSRYTTPEDLLNDHTTPVSLMKQRVEDCLRLVKTRNVRETVSAKSHLHINISLSFFTGIYARNYKAEENIEDYDSSDDS